MAPEQDWRSLLLGIEGLNDKLAKLDEEVYEISIGDVGFTFKIDSHWTTLHWLADLPRDLQPGREGIDSKQFMFFILYALPSMIYDVPSNLDRAQLYGANSNITLDLDPKKSGRNPHSVHSLSSIQDQEEFNVEFTNSDQRIRQIDVHINPGPSGGSEQSYYLGIRYPQDSSSASVLSLGFPLQESTIEGWNEQRVIEWAIATHSDRAEIRDLGDAYGALSYALLTRSDEALAKGNS